MDLKKLKQNLERKKAFLKLLNTLHKDSETLSKKGFNHNDAKEKTERTLAVTEIYNKYQNKALENLKPELMEYNELINDKYKKTVRNEGTHIYINENHIRPWENIVLESEEKYNELEYKQLQRNLLIEDGEHKKFQTEFLKYQKKFLDEEKSFRKQVITENKNIRNLTIILSFIGVGALIYYLSDMITTYYVLSEGLKEFIFIVSSIMIIALIGVIFYFLKSIDISDVMKNNDYYKFMSYYLLGLLLFLIFCIIIYNLPEFLNILFKI